MYVPRCHIYTSSKSLQGWCPPLPGQSVPVPNSPFSEEMFPDIKPKSPLVQLKAIFSFLNVCIYICFKIPYLQNLFTSLSSQLPFNLGLAVFMKVVVSIPVAQNTRTNAAAPHTSFRKGKLLQKAQWNCLQLERVVEFNRNELWFKMMMMEF